MKKITITLCIIVAAISAFSQNRKSEVLKKIDTVTFKPKVKMVAINKVDNTVLYWNGISWVSPLKTDTIWSLKLGPLGRRKVVIDSIQKK